ncbi:hypothetical protein HPB47_010196 [Ixodes persulcatus]|uniref:Uncharacterized protein n=1 Tax=Ixodes persulcatus TaxID=34615 RepID=A0AC60P017_IXOPE|nr:hypothetical protein HPB47_010196 [Ixodes persulcatus]
MNVTQQRTALGRKGLFTQILLGGFGIGEGSSRNPRGGAPPLQLPIFPAVPVYTVSPRLRNVAVEVSSPVWSRVRRAPDRREPLSSAWAISTGAFPPPHVQALGHRRPPEGSPPPLRSVLCEDTPTPKAPAAHLRHEPKPTGAGVVGSSTGRYGRTARDSRGRLDTVRAMASGAREVKASKARHGSGGSTGKRWTAPAVAILKDSVSWQNYRIPKLAKPAPRQSEEHQAGSSAVPRRDYDSPGRHSSGVDDMDPLGASDLLGQVLDNMKKAYSMLNCKGSFGFRLQLSPEKISASKLKEVSARPNDKQQTESLGNPPQLCVKCKRKHVSESSAGDTCIRCSLSQVISAEQAAVKGRALMATKRSPPKASEAPKHSSRRRTSEDVGAAKLLHKPHSVSSENGHGSMATRGRSPCKTPRKKRKKGPWILSSSESSDEGSPPKMDSLSHRKTKRRIASDQVRTMELRLHRVDCACQQAKETVKKACFSRKAQILDFKTTAFLEHFVDEGVGSLDLETRGKITALRMKRLFSDGDSASHSSKQECQKGDTNAIKADHEPKIGKKNCGLKVTSNIHKELVLAKVPCSKASLLPQGASNCRKGEVDIMEVHRKPNISKKDYGSKAASKISKELSLTTVPCSKAFQIPQGASICNKVQKDAIIVDRSKALHLPQEASINREGDAMEADSRPKISKKDHSPKVTSNIRKEFIPMAVPCGKAFQLQQGASNCCKEENAIEANCGLKMIKKEYDHEDYSKVCKELVLTAVPYNETFQLPQGGFNCHKEEGDVMEADCEPKISEENDSSKVVANCFKELVEEECKPELGVASILPGDSAATTREGRENLTQVQVQVPLILEHSCCSLSEADWLAVKSDKDAEVLPMPDVASSLSDNPGALCIALEGLCKDKGVQIKSETLEPLYLDVNSILDSFDAEEQKTKSDGMSPSESNAHQLVDRCLEPSNNDACLLRVEACLAPLPEVGGAHDVRELRAEPLQVCTSVLRNGGAVSPPKPHGMSVPFEDGLQIKGVSVDSSCTNKESPPEAPEPPKGPGCCPLGYPAKQLFGQYLHFLESFFITLDHCTANVRLRLVEALIPRGLVTLKGILEVMRKICRMVCCDEIGRVNCMELRVFALLDESVSVSSPAGALEEAMDLTVELCGDDPALGDNGGCCSSLIHPAVPEPVAERRLQESDIPCRKGGVGEESGAPQNLGIFWSSGMAVPRSPVAQSALPGRVEKDGSVHHGGGVSAPCVEKTALLNPVSGAVSCRPPPGNWCLPTPLARDLSDVIRPRAVLAQSGATSASSVAQAESPASLVVPADQTKRPAFLGPGGVLRLESSTYHRGNAIHPLEGSESVFRSSNLHTYGSLPCRESPTRRAPGPTLSHGSAPHWEGRSPLASSGGKAYDPQTRVRPLIDPARSGALEAALRKGHSPPRYPLLPQPAGNSSVGQPIGVAAERGTTIRTSPRVSSPKDHQPSGKTGSPRRGGRKDGCRDTQVPSLAGQRQTERGVVKMATSEDRYTNLPKVRVQPRQQHPARMRPAPPGNPGQEERVAHQASSSVASKPLSPSESVASCPDLSPSCPTGAGLGWQDPRMSLWALHQLFMAHNVSQSWTARALGGPPSSAAPPNGGISGVSALPGHDSGNPLSTWHSQNLWYRGSLAHHLQMGRSTEPVDSDICQRGQCDVAQRRTADHDQSLARQTQQTVTRSSMWNVASGMRDDYGKI